MAANNQHTIQLGPFKDPMFAKNFADVLAHTLRPEGKKVELEWSKNGSHLRHHRGLGEKVLVEASRDRFSFGSNRAKPDRYINVHFPGDMEVGTCLALVVDIAKERASADKNFGTQTLKVSILSKGVETQQPPVTLGK